MGKNLYITEKPSVAVSFATVLGVNVSKSDRARGYAESKDSIITWCFGHLITLAFLMHIMKLINNGELIICR